MAIPKHMASVPRRDEDRHPAQRLGLEVEADGFPRAVVRRVPSTLRCRSPVTQFHDPAVEFSLTFHADAAPDLQPEHEVPENDSPDSEAGAAADAAEPAEGADDGSNVVSVDFTRKK